MSETQKDQVVKVFQMGGYAIIAVFILLAIVVMLKSLITGNSLVEINSVVLEKVEVKIPDEQLDRFFNFRENTEEGLKGWIDRFRDKDNDDE